MAKVMWDELTAPELTAAARDTGGVCLLPIGVLERHAEHLPLGTDMMVPAAIARAAAEIEPAVVFPAIPFGAITEIKNHAGTVAVPTHLLIRLWETITDEISRNGFHKIVIVNGHGGNRYLIGQLIMELLRERKGYAVYWPRSLQSPEFTAEIMDSTFDEHAGELETSLIMHLAPELVRADRIGAVDGAGRPKPDLGRPDVYSSVDWFSEFPDHYAGDAAPASADKGRRVLEHRAKNLADIIAAIKADRRVAELLGTYYDMTEQHRNPPE